MSGSVLERQLLTVHQVARVFRCTPKTIYRLVHAGRLPAHRLGSELGPLRIDADELEAFLEENRAPTPAGDVGSASAGRLQAGRAAPPALAPQPSRPEENQNGD